MKLKRPSWKFFFWIVAALCIAQQRPVNAASHTWSGATSGNWSVAGNWSSGGVPVAGEANLVLIFPGSPSRYITTNNIAGLTVESIQLNGNAYHVYGNSITLAPAASGTNIVVPAVGIGSFLHLPIVVPAGSFGVSVGSAATLEIQGSISGTGELNKHGGGLLRLNGSDINSFTGIFRQHLGRVALGKTLGAALGGPVYVGSATSTSELKLIYEFNHQIADASDVFIRGESSFLMLEGFNDTIGALELIGSEVNTHESGFSSQIGELRINGNVSANNSQTPAVTEPEIKGRLNLGNAQRTFTVPATRRLLVTAEVASTGANGGITLMGGGNLQLSHSNSFSGPLEIKSGEVYAYHSEAFGSATGPTILDGGDLFMGYGCFVYTEPLDVKQSANFTIAATNLWNGSIQIQTNATLHILSSTFGGYDWLTLGGPITGPGKISYLIDRVDFYGATANTLSGGHRILGNSFLVLAKSSSNALSGPITFEEAYGSFPTLLWSFDNQISDSSSLTWLSFGGVTNSGALQLNNRADVVGSISGTAPAIVNCGTGKLTVGGNNLNCNFSGTISGSGSGTNLVKTGSGTLVLSGSHTIVGKTVVSGGNLILSNAIGVGPVHVSSGTLAGAGQLGALTVGSSGFIAPGLQLTASSYGTLQPSSFNPGSGYFSAALGGTNAGIDYDQIVTSSPINLNGMTLLLSALPLSHGSNSFTLINVTNAGQVTGSFAFMPEGEIFPSSDGKLFQITYQGGDGNDVVVTRYYAQPIAANLNSIVRLPDGRMRLNGTGLVETLYQVQANTNLNTTNWVVLGSVIAGDEFGSLEFVDNNATNFPMRFYRFVLP